MKTKIVGSLEWQEEVPDQTFTWDEAKAYAESMGDGWRLPTVQELLTLVDYARYAPACSVFPDCPDVPFWSSSALACSAKLAWNVCFIDGYAGYYVLGTSAGVRLVRDAKPAVEDVPDTVERLEAARERALRQAVRYRADRSALRAENEKLQYEVNWLKEAGAQCDAELVLHKEERLRLRVEVLRLTRERDEALAEVERLTRERDEALNEVASWRATARDKGESSRRAAAERDALRAEVERLRAAPAEPLDCRECEVEADARFSEFKKTLVRRIPPGSRGDA